MRELLLWCVLALAIVVQAEEQIVPTEDVDLLNDENSRINVAKALGELFEFNDFDDIADDKELGVSRDARAMEEEAKAVVEPEDQARYNKFMDTFYRRLNADARSTIDPIDIPLIAKKSGKKNGNEKKKVTEDKDADKKGGKKKNKKNKKKGNKKKKTNKSKKTARHPKSLNLEEGDDESAHEEVAVAEEEENHHIVTREAEEIEEDENESGLEEQGRSADAVEDEEGDSDSVAARRVPVAKTKKNNKAKKGKKKGNKNKKNKKNKKSKKNNNKSKRSTNKKSNKGKKSARSGPQTSRASVTGIATLVRKGDVTVVNRKDGKELRSDFTLGPVNLKVNRRFGSGKDAELRSATAASPELTGKMHLYVAADGKAKITRFNIVKPSVVTTSGSLNKDENKRSANNNFMENSIGRITPFAAKKLKLAARDVLQATESKN